MTEMEEDFRSLQSLPEGMVAGWVDGRFPNGASVYWWVAVFGMVETSVSVGRDISAGQRRELFELGSRTVLLGVSRSEVSPPLGAYWLLRYAANALRFSAPIEGLPEVLSPDGSVAWALRHMPLSRETAVEYATARAAATPETGDGDLRKYDGSVEVERLQPSPSISALQDVERVLTALHWVRTAVRDERLADELTAWLNTESLL